MGGARVGIAILIAILLTCTNQFDFGAARWIKRCAETGIDRDVGRAAFLSQKPLSDLNGRNWRDFR